MWQVAFLVHPSLPHQCSGWSVWFRLFFPSPSPSLQDFASQSAQSLFFLLAAEGLGTLDALAFSSLRAINAAAQWRRLAECRRFVEQGFGEVDPNAFRALFEGSVEDLQEVEEMRER